MVARIAFQIGFFVLAKPFEKTCSGTLHVRKIFQKTDRLLNTFENIFKKPFSYSKLSETLSKNRSVTLNFQKKRSTARSATRKN